MKAAAQSAFEWEAHASAVTVHYENQLTELRAKLEEQETELKRADAELAHADQVRLCLRLCLYLCMRVCQRE